MTSTESRSGSVPRTGRRSKGARASRISVLSLVAVAALCLCGAVASPYPGRAVADTSVLTLKGPTATGVSVAVTPKDLSTVRQGDTVHLHFAGLVNRGDSVLVGTCPADLPLSTIDFATFGSAATQQACLAKFPTGLGGDIDPTSPNNPGLSTSIASANPRADGTVDVDYLVGAGQSVGTTAYTLYLKNGNGQQSVASLTCDATHPCVIGFEVTRGKRPYSWRNLTALKISPGPNTQDSSGCTGLSASTTLNAAGPERLQNPMAALNSGFCSAAAAPIPVSYVPGGGGENDPTGLPLVGNGVDVAFAGSPLLAKHPLGSQDVAVPVALDAVELAQWGGQSQPSIDPAQLAYNKKTLPGLAVSASDAAGIVLHDYPLLWPAELPKTPAAGKALNPLAASLLSHPSNTAALSGFDRSLIGLPLFVAPTVTYSLGSDSTAIALSAYLTSHAAAAWKFPSNAINDAAGRSGKAVGPIEDFAQLVDRSDNGSKLTAQTSSSNGLYAAKFGKDITSGSQTYFCPPSSVVGAAWELALTKACLRFGVMDTSTATTLGFTATRLGSAAGYTAPSTATLSAAAAGNLNSDGYFDTSSATAYPLTFVEYAVVPTAPLLDSACKVRGQQEELKKFLSYAVGDGQARLTAGLAPLSDALVQQARTAIAKIGTGAPTGACAPKATSTPTPTGSPTTTTPTTSTTTTSSSAGSRPSTTTAAPAPTGNPTALPSTAAVAVQIPAFGAIAKSSPATVMIGLLLLAGLMSAAALGVANGVGPVELLRRAREALPW